MYFICLILDRRNRSRRRNSSDDNANYWRPQIRSENALRLSYPLLALIDPTKEHFKHPKLRHLALFHGHSTVINLKEYLDNSPDLESFYCSAFNMKLVSKPCIFLYKCKLLTTVILLTYRTGINS